MTKEQIRLMLEQKKKISDEISYNRILGTIGTIIVLISLFVTNLGNGFFIVSFEFIVGLIMAIIAAIRYVPLNNKKMDIELKLSEVNKKTLERVSIRYEQDNKKETEVTCIKCQHRNSVSQYYSNGHCEKCEASLPRMIR